MSILTVSEMMSSIAMNVNGNTDVPATGTDDYNLWLQALNDSQRDWEQTDYNWETLYSLYRTTLSLSGSTLPLPTDFRKLAGYPEFFGNQYEEIKMQQTGYFGDSQRYVTIDYASKILEVHPALSSPSDVKIPYYKVPSDLATPTATSPCPSDQYLIYNSSGKVLLSRDNPKYADYLAQADTLLQQMIGKEVVKGEQYDNTTKNDIQTRHGFVLGVD